MTEGLSNVLKHDSLSSFVNALLLEAPSKLHVTWGPGGFINATSWDLGFLGRDGRGGHAYSSDTDGSHYTADSELVKTASRTVGTTNVLGLVKPAENGGYDAEFYSHFPRNLDSWQITPEKTYDEWLAAARQFPSDDETLVRHFSGRLAFVDVGRGDKHLLLRPTSDSDEYNSRLVQIALNDLSGLRAREANMGEDPEFSMYLNL